MADRDSTHELAVTGKLLTNNSKVRFCTWFVVSGGVFEQHQPGEAAASHQQDVGASPVKIGKR